jgi:conjugal transfer ATP-binding protein TraC
MSLFGGKKQQPVSPDQIEQFQRVQESREAELIYRQGIVTMRDLIAPPSLEIESGYLRLGKRFAKTIYVYGYPRQVFTGWLSPIINLDEVIDISLFVYPVESRVVLDNLRRKMGQLEASYTINQEKGKVRDPGLEAAIQDAEELRDKLQVGEERFFRFGLYLTMYADTLEDLTQVTRKIEGIFGQSLVYTKPTTMQMEQGFNSTTPLATDQLQISRNMNTGALSTSFPFTSAELSRNEGILYGLNRHNNGLVLFDRFSLENANMVVFAKSGAGKSFAIKLEALRSLMMGVECIIIDPENEYQTLCEAVGGSYLRLSLASATRINPFDLPRVYDQDEADNALQANIISLHGLLRLMMGGASVNNSTGATLYSPLTPAEDADLDLANPFLVFNIRDLEDELRPVGMYIVLNYIWSKVKADRRKRLLIVDEAWQLMKYDDSANFMFSLAKRARKYFLGLTTISQDVEDFLSSKMGRAVVSNSSLQLLLKQAPSAVDIVGETFKLTQEEKNRLSQFPVGEGLFFAGLNHVIIRILASETEAGLISTTPGSAQVVKEDEEAAASLPQQ